ncbi:MAG: hypothetical protein AB9869_07275 [Verrucomicrobiia bacterium]
MNLNATRTRVESLTRELLRSWDETKGLWRDSKAQDFDAQYMQELAARTSKASAAIEKLEQLLTRVRNDCE